MTKLELAEAADSGSTLVVDRPSCVFEADQHRTDPRAAPRSNELAASWKHDRLRQDQEREGQYQSDYDLHLERCAICRER